MSGPITVVITGEPFSTLLAAAAIHAAQAVKEGYDRAAEIHNRHEQSRQAHSAAQADARERGAKALEDEATAAEVRIENLVTLSRRIGAADRVLAARPARPAKGDPVALAAYIRGLQVFADELQGIVLTETARLEKDLEAEDLELAIPAAATPASSRGRPSQRLLARIAHLGPPPDDIKTLAQELDDTPVGQRATLLATELRRRIQMHAEEHHRRLVEEATATIIRESLLDLGYEVEDVAETFFVEGGTMHFQRKGWGDYMVRMRMDANASEANFNVVRAVDQGRNERSVLDKIAEDRWCAEFPKLLSALEARGVHLDVTRRLEAGEVPVQLVERDKLPGFAQEESGRRPAKPRARTLK